MDIVASLDEIDRVVECLSSMVTQNAIIFLTGNLASGKTTLSKAIAKNKGFDGDVTSPTFSLQHCYGDDLYHYDLYRIDYDQFVSLGLFEEFDRDGWHLVEWGEDRLKSTLVTIGYDCYEVSIDYASFDKRAYTIKLLND